jgi:hypothetical protein
MDLSNNLIMHEKNPTLRNIFLFLILALINCDIAYCQIPSLNGYSYDEKRSFELACVTAKSHGPASYANCLNSQINAYGNSEKIPNLNGYSYDEKRSFELACVTAKSHGPASYTKCLNSQIGSYEKLSANTNNPKSNTEKYQNQVKSVEKPNFSEFSDDLKKEFSRLENERQQLVVERRQIEEEKRQREQAKISRRISLQVSTTTPSIDGTYTISIQTNADTASLKINGEELGGSAEGRYDVKRVARAGQDTRLDIVAKDVYGNTDSKAITVSRPIAESKSLVAALNPAQIKKQPERDAVAIIIGIADYKNLPRAEYANDDARVFYDYAIRALGVKPENIRLLVDGDADDVAIYQAFKTWLPSRVRAGTDVYVYYSGHGLPTADGKGLYLLPQRAHRDFIDKTAITQAEINTAIQAAKPKSVTIFLDSCYSGQARSGETLIASARPVALKAEKQIFPDNFTVITASQADQISSSSPDLKHGIFSYYLMRGMEGDADANKDGRITAGEMQIYLTENVGRQAAMMSRKQEPQLIGDVNRVLVDR